MSSTSNGAMILLLNGGVIRVVRGKLSWRLPLRTDRIFNSSYPGKHQMF